MRHRKAVIKLGRTSSHRNAMLKNMVTSLFKYERIRTTDVKAKALRGWSDHVIGLAKRGDLHARRQALAIVNDETIVKKLFDEAQKRFGDVSGGYTRLAKAGRRPGDAAPMTIIELRDVEKAVKKKKPQPKAAVKAQAGPEQKTEKKESETKAAEIPVAAPALEAQAAPEPVAEAAPGAEDSANAEPKASEPEKPGTT